MAFGKVKEWATPVAIYNTGGNNTHRNPCTFFKSMFCSIEYKEKLLLRELVRGTDAETQKKNAKSLVARNAISTRETVGLIKTGKVTDETALETLLTPLGSNVITELLLWNQIPSLALRGSFARKLNDANLLDMVKNDVEMEFRAGQDEVVSRLKKIVDLDTALGLAMKGKDGEIRNWTLKRDLLGNALENAIQEGKLFVDIDAEKEKKLVIIACALLKMGSNCGAVDGKFVRENGTQLLFERYLELVQKNAPRGIRAVILAKTPYGKEIEKAMLKVLFQPTTYPLDLNEYGKLLGGEGVALTNDAKVHLAGILVSAGAYPEINTLLADPKRELPDEAAYMLAFAKISQMPEEAREQIKSAITYVVTRLNYRYGDVVLGNHMDDLYDAIAAIGKRIEPEKKS